MPRKQLAIFVQSIVGLALTNAVVILAVRRFTAITDSAEIAAAPISASQLIITFLLATTILLFLIRTLRRRVVFEAIFSLSIFLGIWSLIEIYSPKTAFFAAAAIAALRYVFPLVAIQNIIMIAGISGIGAFLGSAIPLRSMAIVLSALAVYDVIAVYGTRHMVTMFKSLLQKGVIFALIIPERPRMLFQRLRKVAPGEGFFFLGSGDIALPVVFVASAAREGLAFGIGAAIGSLVGLFFTDLLFAWGRKRPMPALPPIALGTLLGFLVVMFVR